MRHGAGPGTSGGTDEVITQIENLSTEGAPGHQRLGCCFCNDAASLIKVHVSPVVSVLYFIIGP